MFTWNIQLYFHIWNILENMLRTSTIGSIHLSCFFLDGMYTGSIPEHIENKNVFYGSENTIVFNYGKIIFTGKTSMCLVKIVQNTPVLFPSFSQIH